MATDRTTTGRDAIAFHRRYALAALLAMVALAAVFIALLVRDYRHHQQAHRQLEVMRFGERVAHLDSLLALVTTTIETTRVEAQQDLLISAFAKAIDHQPICELIEDSPDGTFFHIERFRPPLTKEMIGNLTGEGSIKGRDRDFYREIHMAYGLLPHFSSAMKSIESSAWAYYISARGFEAIYPWVSSSEFRFSKQNYTHEYYIRALPKNNPSRSVFWTGVYVDDYGKGLMTTCGAPIYQGDRFLGTVDIDLTIDFLNKAVHRFSLGHGVMFIANEQGQVVAHPRMTASADQRVKLLEDVLPAPLKARLDALARASRNEPFVVDGFNVIKARLRHAPWDVFFVEPAGDAFVAFIAEVGLWPTLLVVAMLCTLAAVLASTHSRYLRPSLRLLRHIEAASHGDISHEVERVPPFWRPWFAQIEQTFRENRGLAAEVRRQNEELEKRVEERTAELAESNRQLEAGIAERRRVEAALRHSEERLQAILDNSTAVVYLKNLEGRYILVNRQYEELFHITRNEIVGKTDHDIFPQDRADAFRANDQTVLAAAKPRVFEEYAPQDDGLHTYISIKFPLPDATGKPYAVCGISTDITVRKQAEAALIEWQNRYEIAISASGHLLYDWDSATNDVTYGGNVEGTLGYTLDEMAGGLQHWMGLIHPEDQAQFQADIEHLIATKEGAHLEYRVRRKDGRYITVEDDGHFVRDAQGAMIRMIGFVKDVTERRRAEERLRAIVQQSPIPTAVGGADGSIVSFNKALEELIGYDTSEIRTVEEWATKLYPDEEYRAQVWKNIEQALNGQEQDSTSFAITCKDGTQRSTEFYTSFFEDGLIIQIVDVTARKRAEEALRESEGRLRTIIDHSAELFFIHDTEDRLTYVSPQSEAIFGYTREEMMVNWTSLVTDHPLNEEGLRRTEAAIRSGERQEPYLLQAKRKDGGLIYIEVSESPLKDENGRVTGIAGVLRDVTDRERASEQLRFLGAIAEQVTDSIVVTDTDSRITYANQAAEALFGYACDELIGQTPGLLNAEPAAEEIQNDIYRTIAAGGSYTGECLNRRKDGSTFVCEFTVSAMQDEHGGTQAYMGIQRDVTELRTASEELRQSEERYRRVVEDQTEFIVRWRPDGVRIFVNEHYCRYFGLTQEEALGEEFFPLIVEEDREAVQQRLDAVTPDNPVSSGDHRVILPDGTIGWNNWTDRGIFDERGRPLEYQSVGRDITDRKQAEAAMEDMRLRLQLALRLSNVGLWDWDVTTDELALTPEWKRQLGYRDDELKGSYEDWESRLHAEDREPTLQALHAYFDGTAREYAVEFRLRHKDGGYRWIYARGEAMRDEEGRPLQMLGCHVDITERKRLETQLREASKMEAIGRLAGGIAHDFNNMLMGMIGYTHFVRQRVDDPQLVSDLDEIRKLADRGASLTQQLLAFSRRQRLERRILDLNHQIESTCRMLPRLIGENIELQLNPAPDLAPVNADPAQIDQILMNLAVNAKDAMPRGGTLSIATANVAFDAGYVAEHAGSEPGDYVMFEVADTGHGMDRETLDHLFEPFYTTKGVGEGTGLGLATIYGIVKQHEGYITVDSELSKGTVFRVYLPRAEGEPESYDQSIATGKGPEGQETVLMVEDEPSVRDVLGRALRNHGYDVLLASNADEALALVEQHEGPIDLLLTDVVMPGRSGRELHAELAAKRPSIKVLFMSGYDEQSVIVRDVRAAGLPFVAKPIDVHEIAERVREALD